MCQLGCLRSSEPWIRIIWVVCDCESRRRNPLSALIGVMTWVVMSGRWSRASIRTLGRLGTFAGSRACFGFPQPSLLPTETKDTELALQLLPSHGPGNRTSGAESAMSSPQKACCTARGPREFHGRSRLLWIVPRGLRRSSSRPLCRLFARKMPIVVPSRGPARLLYGSGKGTGVR